MTTTRKQLKFKAKVALEALRGRQPVGFPVSRPSDAGGPVAEDGPPGQMAELLWMAGSWKRPDGDVERDALYEEIGRLKVELTGSKKKLVCSTEQRRELVEPVHREISLRRQCELLGVNRSNCWARARRT